MNARKRDRIRTELKNADEFLRAAEVTFSDRLFGPSIVLSNLCAFHASLAAFLTKCSPGTPKDRVERLLAFSERFSRKLDTHLESRFASLVEDEVFESEEYAESEARLRIHQVKEFYMEVKDFLRRLL